ncbi:uncharacterized protein LOC144567186 [Carex rostrata]
MARLDRFLISTEWNALYTASKQQTLPNTSSDHCPLLYTATVPHNRTNFFRFENTWLRSIELKQLVTSNWQEAEKATNPKELHAKFQKIQVEIQRWAKEKKGKIKEQIETCREFLGWIDKVVESRQITVLEKIVLRLIKQRYATITVLEDDIWKQRAKIKWESEGDRGSKFFHMVASAAKKTNTIHEIEYQGVMCKQEKEKADAIFHFFVQLMGSTSDKMPNLHWNNLYHQRRDLNKTGKPIEEEEIKRVIREWPNNKSPGPDGFTGEFYKAFCDVITPDIHAVFQTVMQSKGSLHPLNTS